MRVAQSLIFLWIWWLPQATPPQTTPPQGPPPQTPPQQGSPPAPARPQAGTPESAIELPVDLDRIQRALSQTPVLRFDETSRPVFRVQVFGEKPTIDDILGPDWAKGPVPHTSMTHQEFLDMVTPDYARGYSAFSNTEGMTVAATSLLLQWALQKAVHKFRETRDESARAAARQEVIDALNALEEARKKAGLPPK